MKLTPELLKQWREDAEKSAYGLWNRKPEEIIALIDALNVAIEALDNIAEDNGKDMRDSTILAFFAQKAIEKIRGEK